MGSSPTLAHPDPTRDLEDISSHPAPPAAPRRHPAHHPRPGADLDQLKPDDGVPADPHNPYGHQAMAPARPPSRSAPESPSPAARVNDPNPVIWLPARTTGPPTPSAPPGSKSSASGTARNGSAPNANPPRTSTSKEHS